MSQPRESVLTATTTAAMVAVAVLFVTFAVWAVRLVTIVDDQRDAIATNVGHLMTADRILAEDRAATADELAELRTSTVAGAAPSLASVDDAEIHAAHSALGEYLAAIRADNRRISGTLGAQWDSLNVVVAISLVLGLLALAALAFARRSRGRAEALARELALARDRAVESTNSKTRLLADVSHELRTPMVGLVGAAEMLGVAELPDEQRETVDAIRDSAIALRSLLDDLLNLARIDSDAIEDRATTFDARALIESICRVFQANASSAGVTLTLLDSPPTGTVSGNPDRLRQIFTNVVSNAIKFGRRRVDVDVRHVGGTLSVIVDDDGPGIPADKRAAALRPFERLGSAAPGTGLGLPVSAGLARALGGSLELDESALGGARVQVRLPLPEINDPGWAARSMASAQRRGRVLVVDDNAVNRQVLAKMVDHLGHEVWVAENGERAVKRVSEASPDLILMDVNMPGMDGFETTRAVRTDLGYRRRIIAITADASPDARDAARESGMDAVLGKPITLAELDEVLVANMGKTHRRHGRP